MNQFSDEELTAYLDGEHEHVDARALETALANDPELADRLARLDLKKQELKSALDMLLPVASELPTLPLPLNTTESNEPNRLSFYSMSKIAAIPAVLCLLAGLLGGYLINSNASSATPSWRQYVASYQALYVNGTLSPISQDSETANKELERVSKALGKKLDLVSLKSVDQLDFKRAQILGFEGKPLIQMAFLSYTGAPVALCVIKANTMDAQMVSSSEMEGMKSASWQKDGYAYLLIGGADGDLIKKAAEKLSSRL